MQKTMNKREKAHYCGKRTLLVGAIALAAIALMAFAVQAADADTIDVSQPEQVTSNTYYERGQSIIYDGTDYWLFYGRSDTVTDTYATGNPDTHDYKIYYQKASTVDGLATATPTLISGTNNANIYLGETDAACFDGEVWAFASIDMGSNCALYAWSTTDGSSWTEVNISSSAGIGMLPDGSAHFAATTCDGDLWIAYQKGNDWNSKYYDGSTWSSEYDITDNYGTAKFFVEGTNLYFVRADSGDQDIHEWDGSSWTLIDSATESGPYDPTIYKIDSTYVCAYAPWVSPKQWIKAKVGTDLSTLLSAGTEVMISAAEYGGNTWIDMWPTGFTDNNGDTYLFYTSERNPSDASTEIAGNIWYLPVDWTVTNDHYTYIQNAIDAAGSGDHIYVYPGTYAETVTITNGHTDLVIHGDDTERPVIDGGILFDNDAAAIDGVTLENLYLKGDAKPGSGEAILYMANGQMVSDFVMDNCVLDGEEVVGRGGMSGNKLAGTFSITSTEFKDIWSWYVMDLDGSYAGPPYGGTEYPMTEITFADNYIHDCDGSVALRGNYTYKTPVVNVYGNVVENIGGHGSDDYHWAAIEINHAQEVNIYDNVMDTVTLGLYGEGQGFQFWDLDTLDMYNNDLVNCEQAGIFVYGGSSGGSYGGPYAVPGGSIYHNNFEGNGYGIDVESTCTGGPLDAEDNWWGDATGPYHATTNTCATGDQVSDQVDYTPWLDASYPGGSQREFNVFIDANDNGVYDTGESTFQCIQSAIDAASNGDTIIVAAGTYDEQLTIDKSVTIMGAGDDQTFIKSTTASPVITVSANDVTIQNLEITDDAELIEGIQVASGASENLAVDTVDFTNIGHPTGSNSYGIRVTVSFANLSVENTDFVPVTHTSYNRTIGIFAPNSLQLSGFGVIDSSFEGLWTGIYLRSAINGLYATGNLFGEVQSSDFAACVSGIYIGDGDDNNFDIENITVHDNTFTNYGRGVYIWNYANHTAVRNVEIYDNTFTNTVWSSAVRFIAGLGVPGEEITFDAIEVHNNTFTQDSDVGAHVALIDFKSYCYELQSSQIAVVDNDITFSGGPYTDPMSGIQLMMWEGPLSDTVVIEGNTLDGGNTGGTGTPPSSGILVRHWSSTYWPSDTLDVNITHNTITAFDHGITIYDEVDDVYGNLTTGSAVNIHYNNIYGNALYGVRNDYAEVVDATYNWWGDATGPYHATNTNGLGDNISDNVDYTPWLGAAYPGGQPTAHIYIDSNENGQYDDGEPAFTTIQDAIDAASDGDTIVVGDGTYHENLVIDKEITLQAGSGPVIDGNGGVCITLAASNVTIQGFELMNGTQGILGWIDSPVNGDGWRNVRILDNHIHDISNGAWGFGIYLGTESERYGSSHGLYDPSLTELMNFTGLEIRGNEINDTTGASITLQSMYAASGQLVVEDNEVHHGDMSAIWIDCCEELLIEDNSLHDCSTGIFISAYADGYYEGTPNQPYDSRDIDILYNSITGNGRGISLYDGFPATISINCNTIMGNTEYGVFSYLTEEMDATYNWWGDATGPYDPSNDVATGGLYNPHGQGDRVTDYVDYMPYWAQPDGNPAWNYWSNTPHMYNRNQGNVGINTQTPETQLDVNGSLRVQGSSNSYLFFVDATTERIGIGTNNPAAFIHAQHEGNTAQWYEAITSDHVFWKAQLNFMRARGTKGARELVQNGDWIGSLEYKGWDGNTYRTGARIYGIIDGTPGDNNMPTKLLFATTPSGSGNAVDRVSLYADNGMVINEPGNNYDFRIETTGNTHMFFVDASTNYVGIGTSNPTSTLDVDGDIEIGSDDAFYFGEPGDDGTWRIIRSGSDLEFQIRESGVWNTKYIFTP